MSLKIVVIGNCQVFNIVKFFRLSFPTAEIVLLPVAELADDSKRESHSPHLTDADVIFSQPLRTGKYGAFSEAALQEHPRTIFFPMVYFAGFHPDCLYVSNAKTNALIQSATGGYSSSIAVSAFLAGLSVEQTLGLYNQETYEDLGYFDVWEHSKSILLQDFARLGLEVSDLFERWQGQGLFMHTINHPCLTVLTDLGKLLLKQAGLTPDVAVANPEKFIPDGAPSDVVWPVYPELARRLNLEGELCFKVADKFLAPKMTPRLLTLQQFVAQSFDLLAKEPRDAIQHWGVLKDREQSIEIVIKHAAGGKTFQKGSASPSYEQKSGGDERRTADSSKEQAGVGNPYAQLAPHQFWRRSVAQRHYTAVDPVVSAPFGLSRDDRIVTAGSCFAQHIARRLQQAGFNYYVTENKPDGMDDPTARARGYAVYSARYGNIYTVRQLDQLIERAYGRFLPEENSWVMPSGRLVDPFRPQVEPDGFADESALLADQQSHFAAVRQAVETADVFVFTLGLTEGWVSRIDGAAFALAPGVVAGQFDDIRHAFVNYSVRDTVSDLRSLLQRLSQVNRDFRVILTVSPVPLIATREPRSVLTSTTLSKSVLRAAADEICQEFANVCYFPSYEIITGAHSRGRYFDEDLRTVTPQGVDHVMGLFFKHLTQDGRAEAAQESAKSAAEAPDSHPDSHPDSDPAQAFSQKLRLMDSIICDEEAIDPL
ncbi:GSCFA domain-containing protein [Rhodovibrionaceae bacterium A322]